MGTLADLKRSKRELLAENMFLRQQLIVLERQVGRPQMTPRDRQILVVLATSHIRSELRGDSWLKRPDDDTHGGVLQEPDAPRFHPHLVVMLQAEREYTGECIDEDDRR